MKTNFIYAGTIGTLSMLAVVILVVIIKSRKNANKNQADGRLLGGSHLQEEDLPFFCGEQPFVERYKEYY